MTFLHWAFEPDQIRPHLPDRFEVDTWEGTAWVGMTPFVMTDFSVAGLPPLSRALRTPSVSVFRSGRGG